MPIRLLPPALVNRIAAGEVVERPASAVKELVENALDAGASQITVNIVDGGRALITVVDDGHGIESGELLVAVERHATSKLPGDDLARIASLGFRGEALPAIGAVARLTLTSRCHGAECAWSLAVTAGRRGEVVPASHPPGTRVEVRDLFFATPARLKFLRAPRTEAGHVRDVLERLALAHPMVSFTLSDEGRSVLRVQAAADLEKSHRSARLAHLMGHAFIANAISIAAEHDGIALGGLISLPTLLRKTAASQYLFVNGRPIRDRLLGAAVRAAYQDVLTSSCQPVVCLFLTLAPARVDINVHPAKAEVRFRDPETVRSLLVTAIRQTLTEAGCHGLTTGRYTISENIRRNTLDKNRLLICGNLREADGNHGVIIVGRENSPSSRQQAGASDQAMGKPLSEQQPLGLARAQIHGTYIISETPDSLMIIDRHAANECLILAHLQATLEGTGVQQQHMLLMIPEVVHLQAATAERLVSRAGELAALGLVIEPFGPGAVVVRAVPALLGAVDVQGLVRDLGASLVEWAATFNLKENIKEQLYNLCVIMACRSSVCTDRHLTVPEMNALLRQIEVIPYTCQGRHSQLIYVEWKFEDLKKFFGRRSRR
ncbi:DNA mismatch repair protein MutL [invertebrate metagenome]|uniref:DNA mismatch repair protein MutL n=1 Tax=invertebrate metagenome TaxID=1711999 RepID=A0A484HAL8_9ZZZZ